MLKKISHLTKTFITTPLGMLIAIADEHFLYILKFNDDKHLEQEINRLEKKTDQIIRNGINTFLKKVEEEIRLYFAGSLQNFTIPINPAGTNFQQKSWHALQTIPYGQTFSYAQQAKIVESPQGHRAVANANGKNPIIIIIPCHRIINSNGKLGGYTAGLNRKKFLLSLETFYKQS